MVFTPWGPNQHIKRATDCGPGRIDIIDRLLCPDVLREIELDDDDFPHCENDAQLDVLKRLLEVEQFKQYLISARHELALLLSSALDDQKSEMIMFLMQVIHQLKGQHSHDDIHFICACIDGELPVVDHYLNHSPHIDLAAFDALALKGACKFGHLAVVERLLANVNGFDSEELLSSMSTACFKGYIDIFEAIFLLAREQVVRYGDFSELLLKACYGGNMQIIKQLLELHDEQGVEPPSECLLNVYEGDHYDIAEYFLDLTNRHYINPFSPGDDCKYLVSDIFVTASCQDKLIRIQHFLEKGQWNKKIIREPLEMAFIYAKEHSFQVLEFLLSPEIAGLYDVQSRINIAMDDTAENNKLDHLKLMIDYAKNNKLDIREGIEEAFSTACHFGHYAMVDYLLDLNEDPLTSFDIHANEERALVFACTGGYVEIVAKLLALRGKQRINPNINDDRAFRYAYSSKEYAVVRLLLSLSSDSFVDIEANDSEVAQIAYERGNLEQLIYLEKERLRRKKMTG